MFYTCADLIVDRMSDVNLARMYRRTPSGLISGLAHHRFRRTVRWVARKSPFYRDAFRERGIDPRRVRTPADLGDFFTTPADIARDPEKFLCAPANLVFESSGTSGRNKQVYFDNAEMEHIGKVASSALQLMGLTRQDRVANGFDFSMWIPGMLFHQGLKHVGAFCQIFGKVDPIEVYRRLEQYRFTVIVGEPTWLIRLTELAEQHGAMPLKMLIGGAEEMPAAAIPWMRDVWGGATIKMCYGSVEMGGGLGFQPCANHDGYHIDDIDFLPEIIDADADGYGEVVFTTLTRHVMPLVRYRTHDVARLDSAGCSCGIPGARLSKIRGRRDELVVASGGNLYPLMFETILRDVPGLTRDWQVVFTLDGIREVMEIRVETDRTDLDVLQEQIFASAAHCYPDLMKNYALGIFRIKITPYERGQLRTARKLRRLVDLRNHESTPVAESGAVAVVR